MLKKSVFTLMFFLFAFSIGLNAADTKGCISCHGGIEDIRHQDSDMMQQIKALGSGLGDPEGCTVCHGGDVTATDKDLAHKGAPNHPGGLEAFVRDPGSIWIADKTCGMCHAQTVTNMEKSLMQTEAGKIQGNLHTWGTEATKQVKFGNYNIKDEDGKEPNIGTDTYKKYMLNMMDKYPDQFPTELKQIPLPPQSADELRKMDKEELAYAASVTYTRSDCQRCHIGVRGRKGRGDWRGMGCSACHIPYGNEGIYEGNDPTIDTKENGHLLVHMMQSSREAKVQVGDKEFSGLHPETCNSCHNRGKRIGVSYVGLMEQPYGSPITASGGSQAKSHGKRYSHIKADLHFEAGMTCQDCHTSIDMHGDGTIFGTTLAQVEIECSDCHGTNTDYPWELAIGFGEKFGIETPKGPRGLEVTLPEFMTYGTVYDKQGGYLLSTRGNPLGNVVKKEGLDEVIVHLASGKDLAVPLLKEKKTNNNWKSKESKVAMDSVQAHMDNLECYACHADWAPQCYGCHVKVDYTKGKTKIDWIASGSTTTKGGETLESVLGTKGVRQLGKASETRSYLRWEDPILGINGEGLVTPIIPGCQVTFTVIGPDGDVLILNKQAQVPDGPNGSLVAGTDMSPVQPHTTGRKARTCESCHSDPKALGYGIQDGQFMKGYDKDQYVGLQDLRTGEFIAENRQPQMTAIPGMDYDWSQVVTRDGKQLQTVGSHWPGSGPLPQEMRDRMERTGACLGCHDKMDQKELWRQVNTTPGVLSNDDHKNRISEIIMDSIRQSKSD